MNNPSAPPRKLSRETIFLIGDVLPLLDFAGVLLAAYLGTLLYARWALPATPVAFVMADGARAALAAAALAPFILCTRAFVSFASGGQTAAMIRCYVVRFAMFAGAVAALGLASRWLGRLPGAWLALWLAATLLVTGFTRALLVANLRRLERKGILTETVAVVGAGPVADRLIAHLRRTRGQSIEIVGVFDDRLTRAERCANAPTGTIAALLELGKQRPMDWILLTLPGSAAPRLQALVHRLKALAVTVALCPPEPGVDAAAVEPVLPRWLAWLLELPAAAWRRLAAPRGAAPPPLAVTLDDCGLERFVDVAARFGQQRFGYAVTPNADHLLRLHRDAGFRALYDDAAYVLLDSRFLARLLRFTRGLALPVCPGSDLTASLLDEVIAPDDRVVLIGASAAQADSLRQRYGLTRLSHFNPPMGFIRDPQAVKRCLRFVEAHSPFRFCLLAVGAPQQEMIAAQLKARGVARGLALCVGASIDFLTGAERRAPQWMQAAGLEWLFRLLQAPGRMARRYLLRGPLLLAQLRRTQFVLRPLRPLPSAAPQPLPENLPVAIGRRAAHVPGLHLPAIAAHVPRPADHAQPMQV